MRKLLLITALLLVAATGSTAEPTTAEKKELNILFLGNSFTARHNIPKLVKTLFENGQPGLTIHTQPVTYGGQDMFRHWMYYYSQSFLEQSTITDETIRERIGKMKDYLALEEAPAGYMDYWQTIRPKGWIEPFSKVQVSVKIAIRRHERLLKQNPRTKWDYVVLQSWQDVHPDLDKGYAKYVQSFAEVAKQHGTKIILYVTAPNMQNAQPVQKPQAQEQADLELNLARVLAKKIDAYAVVPVPLAINMIQQGGTDLTFRYENDGHPNQTTAFLTASMFYAAVFKESTEGFDYNTVTETKINDQGKDPDGGDAKVVFVEKTKTYLQKIAFEAVQAFDNNRSTP